MEPHKKATVIFYLIETPARMNERPDEPFVTVNTVTDNHGVN